MRNIPKKKRAEIADYYIGMIGLTQFANAYPCQLSGGMKQRVSVARAFANDPEILLMDEPFGALDEQNRLLLQQELLRIWEGSNKTTVFITHSIDEALCLGDRVLIMTARPGEIKTIIPVDLPRPRDIESIRTTPQYNALYQEIWLQLRDEVFRAKN
jgi:NitT/TauT family transport system ATP-binding protein